MMRSRAKKIVSWFLLISVGTAVCLAAYTKISEGKKEVRIVKARHGEPVVETEEAPEEAPPRWAGWIRPSRRTVVPALVSGTVRTHGLQVGRMVGTDEVVVQLNDHHAHFDRSSLLEQKKELELTVADREADHQEVLQMEREGSDLLVTRVDKRKRRMALDLARSRLAAIEVKIGQNKRHLSEHAVRLPYKGVIQKIHVETGQWVNRGQPLFEVLETKPLRVEFHVSARWLEPLRKSGMLRIVGRPGPGIRLAGAGEVRRARIVEISPEAESTTHQFRIVGRLEPGGSNLAPGVVVEVELVPEGKEE